MRDPVLGRHQQPPGYRQPENNEAKSARKQYAVPLRRERAGLVGGRGPYARTGYTLSGTRSRLPVALPVAAGYRPSFRRINSSGSLIRIRCQAR